MDTRFLFNYNSGKNMQLQTGDVFGTKDDKFMMIDPTDHRSYPYFTIFFHELEAYLRPYSARFPIKINKNPLDEESSYRLIVGDVVELDKGLRFIFNDQEKMTLDEAKFYIGKMVYRSAIKGPAEIAKEKKVILGELNIELEKVKRVERELMQKYEYYLKLKKEIERLDKEALSYHIKDIKEQHLLLSEKIKVLNLELTSIEEKIQTKKVQEIQKQSEKKNEELLLIEREARLLKQKLAILEEKKKKIDN